MRSDVGTGARAWRALLLLPLLAGVLAMHVLLLCAAGGTAADPMAGHAGHGTPSASSVTATAHHGGHAATDASSAVVTVLPAVGAAMLAPASVATSTTTSHGGHGLLEVCLAVLLGVALLVLAQWSRRADPAPRAGATGTAVVLRLAHPPPRTPPRLLLCVSRT